MSDPVIPPPIDPVAQAMRDNLVSGIEAITGQRPPHRSEGYLFERRLLGRYIETFDKFSHLIADALHRTVAIAERIDAVVELAERVAHDGVRETAVLQCYQNVSWVGAVRHAECTTGEAIMLGPETVDITFPVEIDGPLEFELRNQNNSFLVMTEIRLGERVYAHGSLIRFTLANAHKGQWFTIRCAKAQYASNVRRKDD